MQIAAVIEEAWTPTNSYITIVVDYQAIEKLQVR